MGKIIALATSNAKDIIDAVNNKGATGLPPVKQVSKLDNFFQLVGLLLLLAFVILIAYLTSKFLSNLKVKQMENSNFNTIDYYNISPGKVLQIIEVANRYFLISINKDSVNLIAELDKDDIVINEIEKTNTKESFKSVLEKIKKK